MEQCLAWLPTRSYRPTAYSTMMHGKDFQQTILLDEPNHVTYMVYGRTYTKAPSLPTDQVSETACQGEWLEYEANHPLNHMVANTMKCTYEPSTWLSRMVKSSTRIDSGPSLARGRPDSVMWMAARTFGISRSHGELLSSRSSSSAIGYTPTSLAPTAPSTPTRPRQSLAPRRVKRSGS